MALSSHFTPTRLYTDKRFLRLSKSDELAASLLLRLYHACDRHGRGPHDDLALAASTGGRQGACRSRRATFRAARTPLHGHNGRRRGR